MYPKTILFLIPFFLISCLDKDSDCFKKQGKEISKIIIVEPFSEIYIDLGIELTIEESSEQSIQITAGENLIENIGFEVNGNELKISDKSGCQLLRSINSAKVLIKSPNIRKIYSLSQFPTRSNGVLRYPKLALETGLGTDSTPSVFEFEIENDTLIIQDNVSTQFHIQGKTNLLEVSFWSGSGRLEAKDLATQEIRVFQRSSNDMVVFPVQKISGKILGTGNLILKNVPPIVEIEQFYTGHIIYP